MGLQRVAVHPAAAGQRVEAAPDILAADLADFAAKGHFVDFVGEVVAVGLDVHGVGGQVEVAGDLCGQGKLKDEGGGEISL